MSYGEISYCILIGLKASLSHYEIGVQVAKRFTNPRMSSARIAEVQCVIGRAVQDSLRGGYNLTRRVRALDAGRAVLAVSF